MHSARPAVTNAQLSVFAGVSHEAIRRLRSPDPDEQDRVSLLALRRVALCLGVAPVELLPQLARRPSNGLLRERGVILPKA